jgi:serine/threonine-protein kinase
MSAPVTAGELLILLEKSRLLPESAVHSAAHRLELAGLTTAEEAADALVAERVLTRYQATRLLEGRRRGLFIDDYKILQILGSGGMGYLYAAEELKTGWQVALKVLSDRHRNNRGMLARFQLEAEAGMRLSHPNIVRTRALRRTEDIYGEIHYMVLELIKGITLQELVSLRRCPLSYHLACDIICQAAAGLQYAHEQGLVHRDVKPANLMIRSDGTLKILDFGLAMIAGSEAEFSLATILGQNKLGTADYIAPEQSIDSFEVDGRADIYSLGCTLYFLLAGQPPFPDGSVSEKLRAHRQQKPPILCEVNSAVPRRVSKIAQKMLAKRPQNRVQRAADVIDLLRPFAERAAVAFDLESILAKRAAQAERRLATESVLRGDSRTSNMGTGLSWSAALRKDDDADHAGL